MHEDYGGIREPELIKECKRKRMKYHAEMQILIIAFPFLACVNSWDFNDI